jgi:Glycosyl transferase family 11
MALKYIVNTNLPHAGLGNMLLVWAKAVAFAELNSLPMVAPMWNSLHIGPWLRGERCKRYYGAFFSNIHYQPRWKFVVSNVLGNAIVHSNLPITKLDLDRTEFSRSNSNIFLFDRMPPWNDYFQELKECQPIIKEKLYQDIHQDLLSQILQKPAPKIGIHIRRSDYQQPEDKHDFAINRCVYTKLEWYIDVLKAIRAEVGEDVPATIFSDGYPAELSDILELSNVSLSTETSALSDMITMSRSRLLIGSSHSSFSAWSSYLGQCPTIWHSDRSHLYEPIFPHKLKEQVYEGGFDPLSKDKIPDILKENLHNLCS